MPPARGDRKPCTARDCTGTMQFGRQGRNAASVNEQRPPQTAEADPKGWVCDAHGEHFREDS